MTGQTLSDDVLRAALVGYETRQSEIETRMADLRRQIRQFNGSAPRNGTARTAPAVQQYSEPVKKRKPLSAEARRRMAAGQKRRWAEHNKLKGA